jgi:hypothetical protein
MHYLFVSGRSYWKPDFTVCSRRIIYLFQVEVAGVKVVVVEVAVTEDHVALPMRGHPEVGINDLTCVKTIYIILYFQTSFSNKVCPIMWRC